MRKKFIFDVIIVFIFVMNCSACSLYKEEGTGVVRATDESSTEASGAMDEGVPSPTEAVTESGSEVYCVYICGAVENEGVYSVPSGSRVNDVLKMAGGYSSEAVKGYVNLAEKVRDGERIYIPYEDDDTMELGTESEVEADGMVNINTAGKDELMTLPGIGSGKADDIIKYREKNGAFGSIEELMNVNGIKEGTFNKLKDKITI